MKDKIKNAFNWIRVGLLFIATACVVFGFAVLPLAKECSAKESKKRAATITQYENAIIGDDAGGIIDFTDPETGVCYFIYKDGYHGMGQGGMTVRYNADGTIMVRDVSGVKVKNDAK